MVLCVMGVTTHSALKALRLQGIIIIKERDSRNVYDKVASGGHNRYPTILHYILIPCTHCVYSLPSSSIRLYYNAVIRWEGMYCYYC